MKVSGTTVALATLALSASVAAQEYATSTNYVTSDALQAEIKEENLMKNLQSLDTIAKANNGNRAFGLPGYAASVDYIWSRIANIPGTRAWKQDFPALFNSVESISFVVNGVSYYVFGLTYSPSTSAEGLTAPLFLGPLDETACTAAGFQGLDVAGKIVLGQRGTCPDSTTLAGRVRAAKSAGAAAVILFNNLPTNVTAGSLSAPNATAFAPAGFINQADGQGLAEQLRGGANLEAYFQQTQTVENRTTQNVFVETEGGDPHNLIMLGAHLDSVKAGAGINDDGSGTSLVMELFQGFKNYQTKNKVRFAWWGAEENGLVGSRYYVNNLNRTEINNLLLYLNFDMVSRGYYGVFDGDGNVHGLAGAPGSDVIEQIFYNDMTSKGINVTAARFTGGSDYAAFMQVLNKPVGGLHTGTGVEQDACYHQFCDDINNPSPEQLTANAKAAAHVLATLAIDGTTLIPKAPSNSTMLMMRDVGETQIQWTVEDGDKHLDTCGDVI